MDVEQSSLAELYGQMKSEIRRRLHEFEQVPSNRYFYELCYCLMTPQSSASQCNLVASELERLNFFQTGFDPQPLLRNFRNGYIRFHNTKSRRLLEAREYFSSILPLLESSAQEKELREALVRSVKGIGYKEASHFLRNIGKVNVAIIDRHILRNMLRAGILQSIPKTISAKKYIEIENLFEQFARSLNIPPAELDLLLWFRETGFILK